MACPFFTTIKMITALMILVFSFMQIMSFRKKWFAQPDASKEKKEEKEEIINQEKEIFDQKFGAQKQKASVQSESF